MSGDGTASGLLAPDGPLRRALGRGRAGPRARPGPRADARAGGGHRGAAAAAARRRRRRVGQDRDDGRAGGLARRERPGAPRRGARAHLHPQGRRRAVRAARRPGWPRCARRACGPRADDDGAAVLDDVPTVSTYHAYAGRIVREHGVRLGVEAESRLLSEAAAWQVAHEAVASWDGPMDGVEKAESTVTTAVVDLAGEMAEHLVGVDDVARHLDEVVAALEARAERGHQAAHPPGRGPRRHHRAARAAGACCRSSSATTSSSAAATPWTSPTRSRSPPASPRPCRRSGWRSGPASGPCCSTSSRTPPRPSCSCCARCSWRRARRCRSPPSATRTSRSTAGAGRARPPCTASARTSSTPSRPWCCRCRRAGATTPAILDVANLVAEPAGAVDPGAGRLAGGARRGRSWPRRHGPARDDRGRGRARRRLGAAPPLPAGSAHRSGVVPQAFPVRPGGRGTRGARHPLRGRRSRRPPAHARGGRPRRAALGRAGPHPWRPADAPAHRAVVPARRRRPRRPRGLGARPAAHRVAAAAPTSHPTRASARASSRRSTTSRPRPGSVTRDSRSGRSRSSGSPASGRPCAGCARSPAWGWPSWPPRRRSRSGSTSRCWPGPGWTPGAARAHLDAFADVAATFAASADRASLGGFLAWLDAAVDEERGLDLGWIEARTDAVQVMTVHAAKGLEWDVVAVPGLVEGSFPAHSGTRTSLRDGGWAHAAPPTRAGWPGWPRCPTTCAATPRACRGSPGQGTPAGTTSPPSTSASARRSPTTASSRSAGWPTSRSPGPAPTCCSPPTSGARRAARASPRASSTRCRRPAWSRRPGPWVELPPTDDPKPQNPRTAEEVSVAWPTLDHRERRAALLGPARAVPGGRRAMRDAGAAVDAVSTGSPLPHHPAAAWDAEIRMLLDERARRRSGAPVDVDLPGAPVDLGAGRRWPRTPSGSRSTCAGRCRPRRRWPPGGAPPSTPGSRSTTRGRPSSTSTTCRGRPTRTPTDTDLGTLQARFLASEWADRTPVEVETSVETVVDGIAVRGRIDAVFEEVAPDGEPAGWSSTGRPARRPPGPGRRRGRCSCRPTGSRGPGCAACPSTRVRGAFFHAATGETVWPDLPGRARDHSGAARPLGRPEVELGRHLVRLVLHRALVLRRVLGRRRRSLRLGSRVAPASGRVLHGIRSCSVARARHPARRPRPRQPAPPRRSPASASSGSSGSSASTTGRSSSSSSTTRAGGRAVRRRSPPGRARCGGSRRAPRWRARRRRAGAAGW